MIDELGQVNTINNTIDFVEEPPWLKLYEKQCELEVDCRYHKLRVPNAHSTKLLREESMAILDLLERENKQMQR
jgi:hypothetical protein